MERQSIIQVTGHANEKSLNDYDEGSEREHRELSHIISGTPQTTTSNSSFEFLVGLFQPVRNRSSKQAAIMLSP